MKYYDHIKKFPLYRWRECLDGDKTFTRLDENTMVPKKKTRKHLR